MSELNFRLLTLRQTLFDGSALVEAAGFPEISALDESVLRAEAALGLKAREVLSTPELSPALGLHRRRLEVAPEVAEVQVEFEPPRRVPEWETAVTLRFHVVRWAERSDLFQAWIPALGIVVLAADPESLARRVPDHIRLALISRSKRLHLGTLAATQRVESLTTSHLSVTAPIRSPLEIESAASKPATEPMLLPQLADELSGTTATTPLAYEVEGELRQLAEILSGPRPRSVLLVGPPGCGKTALVHELARRRAQLGFPQTKFWSTSGARLMTGQTGFGMWQDRCQKLCREVASTRAVLHLGSLAELQEVGKVVRSGQSVGGFLQPWLARGEVLAIAECTADQQAALERAAPQLLAAFQVLSLKEPTPEALSRIVTQVWTDAPGPPVPPPAAALDWLRRLHARYATYSANPGRPVRFLRRLLTDQFPSKSLAIETVTTAFSRETGLPAVLLDDRQQLDLEATRAWFAARVVGQPAAVGCVLDVLATVKARLARPRRPLASLLLVGPTGTGKTELAKTLAQFLFGDASRLTRFDLSEFSNPVSVQRLIGGGVTGLSEGLLTARLREQPFSVLLFDEFEKADPAFFDLLLQVLGEGRLTDAAGRVADFANAVIVMTSNLGAEAVRRGPSGFRPEGTVADASPFTDAVRQFLRPEIFNRLDAIVPFAALEAEVVQRITRKLVEQVGEREGLRQRKVELQLDPEVIPYLAARGYDARYGARPLKRCLERELIAPLSAALNEFAENLPVTARVSGRPAGLTIQVRARPTPPGGSESLTLAGIIEELMRLRRTAARLSRASEVQALENQVSLLEALERTLARGRWKAPGEAERVGRLPALRQCLAAVQDLAVAAGEAESDALLWSFPGAGTPPDLIPLGAPVAKLWAELRRLQREILRLGYERPDTAVIALFTEPREFLPELAGTYYRWLASRGVIERFDYFLAPRSGRSGSATFRRESAPRPTEILADPPDGWAGVLMQVKGELYWPWLKDESGIHAFIGRNPEWHGLVLVQPQGFEEFVPPTGIDRPRGIKASGRTLCRQVDRGGETVADAVLGNQPMPGGSFDSLLVRLLDQRLELAIRTVGGPA